MAILLNHARVSSRNAASFLLMLVGLPACSLFTAPESQPLVTASAGDGRVLATMADRRVIYTTENGLMVAEPPPDAMQEISSKFDLSAALKGKGDVSEASLALYNEVNRHLQRLATRSQGIIFFRDATFRLAEAAFNERITAKTMHEERRQDGVPPKTLDAANPQAPTMQYARDQWDKHFTEIVQATERLIALELEVNPTLGSGEIATAELPDLFVGSHPIPLPQGGTLTICYVNPSRAGSKVTIHARASSSSNALATDVLLDIDANGFGTAELTVDSAWTMVLLDGPDTKERRIPIKR